MIVPVSIVSTDGFERLRALFRGNYSVWASHYAERPSKLFTGVEKRLTIWLAQRVQKAAASFWSTHYHRWLTEERNCLLATIRYVPVNATTALVRTSIPKLFSPTTADILTKIARNPPLIRFLRKTTKHRIYYTRKLRYFVQFFDFVPKIFDANKRRIEPSELKDLCLDSDDNRDVTLAVLNSSLFFAFFTSFSDVRNVNRREIELFPIDLNAISGAIVRELAKRARLLMVDYNKKSSYLTNDYKDHGILKIQTFQPRESKPIIDEIDRVMAQHYGFTDEELDFIINYDIKYRMGRDTGEEEE